MISAGIDCGAKNTKTVILRDGHIIGKGMLLTRFDQKKAIRASWEAALKEADILEGDVARTCITGSGKVSINNKEGIISDTKAMAKGANFFFPNARTVADVGAEEGRAVKIDDRGNVVDFAINEKCAAGAGAFLEVMARALEVSLEEMGRMYLQSKKEIAMNAQCVVFAESEVVGLIHAKTQKPDISKAIHDAMAGHIISLIRRVGVNEDVVLVGGVSRNSGFVDSMKRHLTLDKIYIPDEPEYGAALGAAVVAAEEARKDFL